MRNHTHDYLMQFFSSFAKSSDTFSKENEYQRILSRALNLQICDLLRQ